MRLGLGLGINNPIAGGGAGFPSLLLDIDASDGTAVDNEGHTLAETDVGDQDIGNTSINTDSYNGTTSRMNVSDWANDLIGNITVVAWIKVVGAGEGGLGRVFENGKFVLYYQDSLGRFQCASGSSSYVNSAGSLLLDSWMLLVVTRTSTGVLNFYIDGVLSGSADQDSGTPEAGTVTLNVGNNSFEDKTFNGNISRPRIYNGILTDSQISKLYQDEKAIYVEANAEEADYYVSNDGSDGNDGLTPATAWASITKANTTPASGSIVAYRRGDTWVDDIDYTNNNVHAIAYGDGAKPIITGDTYGVLVNKSSAWISSFRDIHFKNSAGTYNAFIYVDVAGSRVEFYNCDFTSTGSAYVRVGEASNTFFNNCTFVTASGTYALYSTSTGFCHVEDSVIDSGGTYGIIFEAVAGSGVIRRNKINAKDYGIFLVQSAGVEISYNLITGMTGTAGTRYGIRLDSTGLTGIHIFNNTIAIDGDTETYDCVGIYGDSGITFTGACSFYNNIVNLTGANISYFVRIEMDFTANLTLYNNVYYEDLASPLWRMVSSTYSTLATWQAVAGDEGSVNADPSFAETTNYTLDTDSPALGLGSLETIKSMNTIPGTGVFKIDGDPSLGSEKVISFKQGVTYPLDTLTTLNRNITEAVESTGNIGGVVSELDISLLVGQAYELSYDFVLNSGTLPNIRFCTDDSGRGTHKGLNTVAVAGVGNTFIFTPTTAVGYLEVGVGSGVFTDFAMTNISIKRILNYAPATRYIECLTAGTLGFVSNDAYGTWEFDIYKGNDASSMWVQFINDVPTNNLTGYQFYFDSNERLRADRESDGVWESAHFYSATSYKPSNTWVHIKITRSIDGQFHYYADGALISVESGSNPITDNTYTISKYFVLDLGVGDRIRNIEVNGVRLDELLDLAKLTLPMPIDTRRDSGANEEQITTP